MPAKSPPKTGRPLKTEGSKRRNMTIYVTTKWQDKLRNACQRTGISQGEFIMERIKL